MSRALGEVYAAGGLARVLRALHRRGARRGRVRLVGADERARRSRTRRPAPTCDRGAAPNGSLVEVSEEADGDTALADHLLALHLDLAAHGFQEVKRRSGRSSSGGLA